MTFQSTHPLRGATPKSRNHRIKSQAFQSTHPLRGATSKSTIIESTLSYFNPRTPCGVRQSIFCARYAGSRISIHAPLAGCDRIFTTGGKTDCKFQSTHPLRGATSVAFSISCKTGRFQSTHPLRGATHKSRCMPSPARHFNPRTPCGVRPKKYAITPSPKPFQSTHPLRGATFAILKYSGKHEKFQSTHPLRGATSIDERFREV